MPTAPSPHQPDRLAQLLRDVRDPTTLSVYVDGDDPLAGLGPAGEGPHDRGADDGGADADGPHDGPHDGDAHDDGWDVLEGVGDDRLPVGRHRPARGRPPVLSVPASLRSVDLAVGAGAVRGLLVVAVVLSLVLGGRWWWAQQSALASPADRVATHEEGHGGGADGGAESGPEGEAEGGGAGGEGTTAADPAGATAAGDETGSPPGAASSGAPMAARELVVHVTGQVVEPGVVRLAPGSRVVDAVRAAGGLTAEADQAALNLARQLSDGEQVWVGRPGETPPPGVGGGTGVGGTGTAGGSAGDAPGETALVDLNLATQADLEELPGIGPVTAGHILTWRDEHGRFSRVDELLEVSGIGERTLAQLEPLVTVGG